MTEREYIRRLPEAAKRLREPGQVRAGGIGGWNMASELRAETRIGRSAK